MRGTFLGQHLVQAEQRMLGRHVGRFERRALVRVHRAHVDHHAATVVLVHVAQRCTRGQERAIDVDGLHLFPVGERVAHERIDDLDAGVRDEDVDRAEFFGHAVDAAVHGLFIGHVHTQANGLAAGIGDFLGDGLGAVFVQVNDGDGRARTGEREGDLLADAAGGTRDDGDFAFQIRHVCTPRVGRKGMALGRRYFAR